MKTVLMNCLHNLHYRLRKSHFDALAEERRKVEEAEEDARMLEGDMAFYKAMNPTKH